MTSRPRTAKKAAAEPAATPAKRTAKKTAAKRATGTPRKRTQRKPAADIPALTLVKPHHEKATDADDKATQVDTRPRLTVRRRLFVGPMGPREQAAVRAALAAARLGLPITVRTWNGSQAQLADGTILIHNPGPDRTFTAHIACRRGSIHGYPITNNDDLRTARAVTHACERRHTTNTPGDDGITYDLHKAMETGIRHTSRIGEGLKAAKKSAAETQPLSKQDIAEGLAARAADTAKEHPQT